LLLLDNSAWARLGLKSLAADRRAGIATMIENGELAVCTPFLLEAGWSARNAANHESLLADLTALPRLRINNRVEDAAIDAQGELARRGHHRGASPSDLLIAACAHVNGVGVLHYDRDYDVLGELTSLIFDSEWLATPGSL
jgi:predicted nucleic acid-binding protein